MKKCHVFKNPQQCSLQYQFLFISSSISYCEILQLSSFRETFCNMSPSFAKQTLQKFNFDKDDVPHSSLQTT